MLTHNLNPQTFDLSLQDLKFINILIISINSQRYTYYN